MLFVWDSREYYFQSLEEGRVVPEIHKGKCPNWDILLVKCPKFWESFTSTKMSLVGIIYANPEGTQCFRYFYHPKKGGIKSNDLEWELHFNICIEFNSNVGNSGARPITNFIIFHDKYYNIRHSG